MSKIAEFKNSCHDGKLLDYICLKIILDPSLLPISQHSCSLYTFILVTNQLSLFDFKNDKFI